MNTLQLLEKLYVTKDFKDILPELQNKNDEKSLYLLGKIFFEERNLNQAFSYFEKANAYVEMARCKFFQKDLKNAKHFLSKTVSYTKEQEWLEFLIDIIEHQVKKLPTFFLVRNFLEVDLSILLDVGNIDYAEIIINSSDLFVQANSEANKFFARVLYNYNYISLSQLFLDRSLDVYYNDPETHFLKAQCYLAQEDKSKAKEHLYKCLDCSDNYFPAQKLLKEII